MSDLTVIQSLSLTSDILEELDQWNCQSDSSFIGISSRTLAFFTTSFTELSDAILHAGLSVINLAAGVFVSPYNFVAKWVAPNYAAPHDLEISSAFIHLIRTVEHLFFAIVLPFVAFVSLRHAAILSGASICGLRPDSSPARSRSSSASSSVAFEPGTYMGPSNEEVATALMRNPEAEEEFLSPFKTYTLPTPPPLPPRSSATPQKTVETIYTEALDLEKALSEKHKTAALQLPKALRPTHATFIDRFNQNPLGALNLIRAITSFLEIIQNALENDQLDVKGKFDDEEGEFDAGNGGPLFKTPLKVIQDRKITVEEAQSLVHYYTLMLAKVKEMQIGRTAIKQQTVEELLEQDLFIQQAEQEQEKKAIQETRLELSRQISCVIPAPSQKILSAQWNNYWETKGMNAERFKKEHQDVLKWCMEGELNLRGMVERHKILSTQLDGWKHHSRAGGSPHGSPYRPPPPRNRSNTSSD